MSGEEPKLTTTTIGAYDLSQLRAAYKSVLMGVGMMAVMHIYFKYTNPLLIQSMFPSYPPFSAQFRPRTDGREKASSPLKAPSNPNSFRSTSLASPRSVT